MTIAPDPGGAVVIRLGTAADCGVCSELERRASLLFDDTPHAFLANDAAPVRVYAEAAARGDVLVAEMGEVPAGFAMHRFMGRDVVYVAEIAVDPAWQRRRIGAALLEAVRAHAAAHHRRWLVLRTFRDIPWNAPYYRRLGFGALPPGLSDAALDEMATIAAHEAAYGLAVADRLFLARRV